MTRDERVLKDLADNFRDKIFTNIDDYLSLCNSADLDRRDSMAELMYTLMRLAASFAADQFNVSSREFSDVMAQQFERARSGFAQKDES